jgi:YopT peptidase
MDAVELLRVQAEYQGIQTEIVDSTGAVLVSPFTQSREPMLSFCKRYSNTSGGICEALVARWIGDHANDVSLWDELLSYTTHSGTRTYSIKIDVINEITTQQHLGSWNQDQRAHTESYLRSRSVLLRRSIVGGHASQTSSVQWRANAHTIGAEIAQIMSNRSSSGEGFYAMLAVKRDGGGHVMGAFIGSGSAKDVAFFDPNYGDFWFKKKAIFGQFLPHYIQRHYAAFSGYDIRMFGRDIRTFRRSA